MADLASSDVTVTIEEENIIGKKRWNFVKVVFGDGALTYPANGVPLPAAEKFGMRVKLDRLIMLDTDDAIGLVWKWDKENNKLRAYVQGATVGAAGSETLDDFPVTAGFGVTADTHMSLKAGSGTVRIGALKEASGGAPAATTMYALAIGY